MQVILEGSLRHFPPAQILALLGAHGHSGTLDARGESSRTRVFLRDGRVAWAEGMGSGIEAIVLDLLRWREGTFTVLDEVELPAGVAALSIEIAPLIEQAAKTPTEPVIDGRIVFQVVDNPSSEVTVSPESFRVLMKVGGGKSVADVATELGRDLAETYLLLTNLETAGLVTRGEKAPARAPEQTVRTKIVTDGVGRTTTGVRKRPPNGSLTSVAGDQVHPLMEDEITVGRDQSNAIAIADGSVSSHHARIVRTEKGFVLHDLQSRNGTFVNSDRVTGEQLLANDDTIRFGRVVFIFNVATTLRRGSPTQNRKID